MKVIFFLQVLFLHNVWSCWFSKNINKMACSSTLEIAAEGTDKWDKLHLFNNNKQIHLKKETFKRTPNLVDLTVASISSIEAGAFNGLNKLDKLSIYQSELEEVPLGVLDKLPIRNLQVFVTKVKRFQPGFFNNFTDLAQVDLRNNSIKEVKKGVFDNTQIIKLYLDNNGIDKIEDKSFENMENLIYLGLHGNLLESFICEQYIGTSNSLTNLWLNNNKLTKITKDMFTTVPTLTNLYLELNQIEYIEPESFHKIPLLQFIDISNNKLRNIHPHIFLPVMKDLNYISLQNNQLTFINKAFFQRTPKLKFITYGGNPFQCPCSEELDNLIRKKGVRRICDTDYNKGERPSCVIFSSAPAECLYDEELTSELFELFQNATKDYPRLELKCDTTNGLENAYLNHVENV